MLSSRREPKTRPMRDSTPCSIRWDWLAGGDRVRWCPRCRQNVYQLNGLSASQRQRFVRESEHRRSVRLYVRCDGTILAADCRNGARDFLRVFWISAVLLGLVVAGVFYWLCHRFSFQPFHHYPGPI